MPQNCKLLFYTYKDGIADKRRELLPNHLEHSNQWAAEGRVLAGGPTQEPMLGGMMVFSETGDPEEWMRVDPYIANGIVAETKIVPWTVGVGRVSGGQGSET